MNFWPARKSADSKGGAPALFLAPAQAAIIPLCIRAHRRLSSKQNEALHWGSCRACVQRKSTNGQYSEINGLESGRLACLFALHATLSPITGQTAAPQRARAVQQFACCGAAGARMVTPIAAPLKGREA